MRGLWDQSHVMISDSYGTDPMDCLLLPMGPMSSSERPMGPVPCIDLIYLWDWSHTLLCDIHGTSQDLIINIYLLSPMCGSEIPMGPVPCIDLRQLWD